MFYKVKISIRYYVCMCYNEKFNKYSNKKTGNAIHSMPVFEFYIKFYKKLYPTESWNTPFLISLAYSASLTLVTPIT